MAEFITGKRLADEVYDIIFNAKRKLLIISPYIKLDSYFKDAVFNKHKANSELHLIIAFGKNEKNPERSFNKTDFEYFKEFPHVSIVYIPNLHAKYYANETKGIVTSINLYDYSFKNNIEYGIVSETKLIGGTKIDEKAWDESMQILENNYAVFIRRPKYNKKLFSKNYVGSEIELDYTDKLLTGSKFEKVNIFDYMDEKHIHQEDQKERLSREEYDVQESRTHTPKKQQKLSKFKVELLSATALGKSKNMTYKEVINVMEKEGLIFNNEITNKGDSLGLVYESNKNGQSWIVYPRTLNKIL